MSYICPNCQTPIEENVKFCPTCGQKVVREEESPTTETNEPVQGNDNSSASPAADPEITTNSENTPVNTTDQGNEQPKATSVGESEPQPQPVDPNTQDTATSLLDNLLQHNILILLIGIIGSFFALYWIFCAKNNWVWMFWGILAGALFWFWKDIIGKKNPKKSEIWTIIIAIILGSCCNNSKLVYSEKDVEKLVKGTTWSVTGNTVKGYKGLWLKYELKKSHTAIVYYANPSEGKWTRFNGSYTWKTISGRYSDTGNEYYGVEINPGRNRIIFQDGEAVLYWADQEPTLIEEGDNAPW